MRLTKAAALFIAILGPSAAGAQQSSGGDAARNAHVEALTRCRSNTDSAARLACYDAAVAALDEQVRSNNVVVMTRDEVRSTRRSLFGFSLPRIRLFNDGDGLEEQEELTAGVTAFRSIGYGTWQITLDNGAVWQTTEPSRQGDSPRVGGTVRIRRAAFGSYFLNIGSSRAVRARRTG